MTRFFSGTIFKPSLGSIRVSVSMTETYAHEATISEHPIERGSAIGDHIQTTGVMISMEGIITDVIGADGDETDDDLQTAYSRLEALFEKRDVFQLITGMGVRDNMGLKSLHVKRDKESMFALGFTAEMKQLRFVEAGTVLVKADTKAKSGKTKDLGHKATLDAPKAAAQDADTMAKHLINPTPALVGPPLP